MKILPTKAGKSQIANMAVKWKHRHEHGTNKDQLDLHKERDLDPSTLVSQSETFLWRYSFSEGQALEVIEIYVWLPEVLNEPHVHTNAVIGRVGHHDTVIKPDEGQEDIGVDGEVIMLHPVDVEEENGVVNLERLAARVRHVHGVVGGGEADLGGAQGGGGWAKEGEQQEQKHSCRSSKIRLAGVLDYGRIPGLRLVCSVGFLR